MENPTQKLVDDALDAVKAAVQEIEKVKASVFVLKFLLGAQTVGKDPDRLRAFLAEFQQAETRLVAEGQENIALVFEGLKHLLRKGSAEPDA